MKYRGILMVADITTLRSNGKGKRSLITAFPPFIRDQFELKKGDQLRWRIEGNLIVIGALRHLSSTSVGINHDKM